MQDQKIQTISKDDQVRMSSYSELMNNYFPESTIQAGKEIRTLMIAEEQPLVFYLDKEDKLKALLRKEGSASGWLTFSLSNNKVKSFELEYNNEEEQFQIAKVEDNQVWISQKLPLGNTNFEDLDQLISWEGMTAGSYKEQIDKVSLGTEHVLFATSEPGKDALYYLADLESLKPQEYTLPENAKEIVSFELGNFLFTSGVFFLYKLGQTKSMLYQSFSDPVYNKVEQRRFEVNESINCFALLEGEDGNDLVYAAGKQVHEFAMATDGEDFNIQTLPGIYGNIQKIRSAGLGKEKTIWALDEKGLHYQTNRFFDHGKQKFSTDRWTAPLLMVEHADQFSCVKGKGARNQLYSLSTSQGSELTRLWQDEVTTMWNQHKIYVEATDSLKEVESYSAHIRFNTDTSTKSFLNQKIWLSSDSNLFVYINSKSYHLGPDHKVSVPLGIIPELTIICPVNDIASGNITITADFLRTPERINLTGKVLDRLESKISDGGLGNAKLPNGKKLVPVGVDSDTIKGAEKGISQMLNAAKDMETEHASALVTGSNQVAGVGAASFAALPTTAFTTSGIWADAGHTLGDFFHSIWNKAKEAFEFVVERVADGMRFIIKIGEKVFDWVVKTIREIGGFIQKVFESIKVFFKDLFEFLAFLFDWNSILATKNALKGFTNNAVASLKGEVESIRKFVNETLDKEIAKFNPDLVKVPDGLGNTNVADSPKETKADPRSNWLNSKKDFIDGGKGKSMKDNMPSEFGSVFENLIKDLGNIFSEIGDDFVITFKGLIEDFNQVITGKMTFVDFLKSALNKLAGMGLSLVKNLMNVILVSLEALLDVAYVGLNKAWHIPLISDLYKSISGGEELSFLDVMCLFVAIPTTILYKIGEGKAPFASDETREAFVKSGERVFQLNLN